MNIVFIFLFGLAYADVILKTTSGPVRGVTAFYDDEVEAFMGIPYAEPPVGDLRFAKPVPKKQWQGVYNASKMPPPCAQYTLGPYYFMPNVTNMSEDCLYLSIWVPKSKSTQGLRPVIVFIYGGGFSTGSSDMYDGSKLAKRGDLVFAIMNYRVGSFGYFLGNVKEANGNMGMYDQVMAIQWIKDNAQNFGGDPENIVLMGESAGAYSISAHIVSPISSKLFNRAIMESGSIMHPYFQDDNAKLLRNSEMVASIVGCANETMNLKNNPRDVVDCLKKKPKEDLIAAEKTLLKTIPIIFMPRVHDEFLPRSPRDLILEGKFRKDIDILMGVNRDEGTIFLSIGVPEYFGYYGRNNSQSISKNLVSMMVRGAAMMTGQQNFSEIFNHYMKQVRNHTSTGYTKMLADVVGDFIIACATKFCAELFSLRVNNVYFYNFEFRAASTPMAEWIGITHGDELQFVFGIPIFAANFTDEEFEVSTHLINRWSAFARSGDPNVPGQIPWPRYGYHTPLYLNIGQEEETIRMNPIDRCEIWRKRFGADIPTTLGSNTHTRLWNEYNAC